MKLRTLILGSVAALGLSAASAKAADLEDIADFALNICDAVNATGITISSADHCMKFSGEFNYEKWFNWDSGGWWYSEGFTELDLTIEVMGDSDFGVTRGWLKLHFWQNSELYMDIEEIGISIGNATVLATGSGASIWNADQDETLNHLLAYEIFDGDTDGTGGVYVSVTHDLGNGWSIAKAIECIDSCDEQNNDLGLVGVVSYDNEGITGHMSVLFSAGGGMEFESVHAGIQAELDTITVQGAFAYSAWNSYWEANVSIKAVLDMLELAGGFTAFEGGEWWAVFSLSFDAGDFTISKAFGIDETGYWEFETEVSTSLSDNLALAVNFYLNSDTDWEVSKTLTWTPGGGYEATGEVGFNSDSELWVGGTTTLAF